MRPTAIYGRQADMMTKRILNKRGGWLYSMRLLAACTGAGLVVTANALAQAPNFGWAAQGHGNGGLNDMATGVATDQAGNTYVSGDFCSSSISFGGVVLAGASPFQLDGPLFLVKYDNLGNVLWAQQSGPNDISSGAACAPAHDGGVFLAGGFGSNPASGGTTLTLGGTILTNYGEANLFVARFAANGDVLWARQAGGSNGLDGTSSGGAATDANDNLYVSGILGSTDAIFGSYELSNSQTNGYDGFLAKYDNAGNVLWAHSIKGGYGILATDASGYSYVTGGFTNVLDFGSGVLLTNSSGNGTSHGFLTKYDPSGNALWAREYIGTGSGYGSAIAAPSGGCFIGGSFSATNLVLGAITLTNRGGNDAFVAKYDSDGNLLWAQGAGGSSDDTVYGIAADGAGNCYAVGWSTSTNFSAGGLTLTNSLHGAQQAYSDEELFILKYGADGTILWARGVPMVDGGDLAGIAVDCWANTHVAGTFEAINPGVVDFDGITLTNTNPRGSDVFVAQLEGTRLTIQPQGGQILISWPTNAAGLSLESTGDLGTAVWSPVTNRLVISGQNNTVMLGLPAASQFFRLSGP